MPETEPKCKGTESEWLDHLQAKIKAKWGRVLQPVVANSRGKASLCLDNSFPMSHF